MGIGESAIVALIIFVLHLLTLFILVAMGFTSFFMSDFSILKTNWAMPPMNANAGVDIFFGFCSGLLGVSGYETSANYVEEQKDGVFPKTLRNMASIVAFFNPLLGFLAIAIIPVSWTIAGNNQLRVLGEIGYRALGYPLQLVVSIDAVLVLSGAVLTSFVGVTGLVRRMSLDRCLPQFLLNENSCRGTNHWIIIGFFLLTSSLYLIVWGNVETLSGVYTVAFLSVLGLFAIGNLFLKYKRSKLPRNIRALTPIVLIAFGAVVSALVGNIIINLRYLEYFSIYFSVTITIVIAMLTRTKILRWIYKSPVGKFLGECLKNQVYEINAQEMVFFTKTADIALINKAIQYVRDNELTSNIRICHVYKELDMIPANLREYVHMLDLAYPKMRVDLTLVKGNFNPAMVEELTGVFGVPKNFMYITCPSESFAHKISEFGGVRLITH